MEEMERTPEHEPEKTPVTWEAAADAVAEWEALGDSYTITRHEPLTQARQCELLEEICDLRRERREVESEAKDAAKEFKKRLTSFDAQVDQACALVRNGETVQIAVEKQIRAQNVRLVSVETGEVIEERAATDAEMQLPLPLSGRLVDRAMADARNAALENHANANGGADAAAAAPDPDATAPKPEDDPPAEPTPDDEPTSP